MNNNQILGVGYCPTCLHTPLECICLSTYLNTIPKIDTTMDWFNTKLNVGSYPYLHSHFFNNNYDYIINVSDEYYWETDKKLQVNSSKTFWFPMSETVCDIGLNSIYGALVILYNAEKENKSVYLHCHAGTNRSEIVRAAYYYMKNNKQFDAKNSDISYLNRLVKACYEKKLPTLEYTEQFLTLLGKFLNNFNGEPMGGLIDEIKLLIV